MANRPESESVLLPEPLDHSAALRQFAEYLDQRAEPHVQFVEDPITEHKALVAFVPEGREIVDLRSVLDAHMPRPRRARGTLTAYDEASFVALVDTFKDSESRIFAAPDSKAPVLLAVLDHHETYSEDAPTSATKGTGYAAMRPRWGEHQVRYACPLSEEWKAWTAMDGKLMKQGDFAAFLEDRLPDVVLPETHNEKREELIRLLGARVGGPAAVLGLSRGLEVNVGSRVKQIVTLETGEIRAHFETTHTDGTGAPIQTANMFFIAIPVFFNGPRYELPVRLRYRLEAGSITWFYQIHRPDLAFDDAFRDIVTRVRERTELLTVLGTPEVAR